MMIDLMQYLYDAYLKDCKEAKKKSDVEKFVAFCRKHLLSTPPIGVFSARRGIGLKMSDGTEVPVLTQELGEDNSLFMPITKPTFDPLQHGINDTRAKNVFGGD
jgi:hypothetical protein